MKLVVTGTPAGEDWVPSHEWAAKNVGFFNPVDWLDDPDSVHVHNLIHAVDDEELARFAAYYAANRDWINRVNVHSLAAIRDKHKGATAFLLGSGPSLSKNLAMLEKYIATKPENVIVIAMNNAIWGLTEEPDYMVWTERDTGISSLVVKMGEWNLSCKNLIAYPFVHPETFTNIRYDNCYLVNDGAQGSLPDVIRKLWDMTDPNRHQLLEMFTVTETAQLAAMLPYYLGCKEVVMLGCDYSYKDSYYHLESAEPDDDVTIAQKAQATAIKDINGDTVYQTRMQTYRHRILSYHLFCYHEAGMRIVNATEGGVLTQGPIEIKSLENYLDSK